MRVPLASGVGQHGAQELVMVQQPFHHSPLLAGESDGRPDDGRTKQRMGMINNKQQFRNKTKKKYYVDASSLDSYNPGISIAEKQMVLGMPSPNQVDASNDALTNTLSPIAHSLPASLNPYMHPSYSIGPGALHMQGAPAAYQHIQYSHPHSTQTMFYLYPYSGAYLTQAQATSPVVNTVAPVLESDHATSIESYNCAMEGSHYEGQELSPLQTHPNYSNSGQEQCCGSEMSASSGDSNISVTTSTPPGFHEIKSAETVCTSTVAKSVDNVHNSCTYKASQKTELSAQKETVNSVSTSEFNGSESEQRTSTPECESVVNTSFREEKSYSSENSLVSNNPSSNQQKCWADLFKPSGADTSAFSRNATRGSESTDGEDNCNSLDNSTVQQKFGNFLQSYQIDFTPKPIQPRGLINRSNWCYINATLQAILTCTPFYNLINSLVPYSCKTSGKTATPIMDSLIELCSEFTQLPTLSKIKHKDELNVGPPFEPICIHKMLSVIKSECVKGRQEDAEEFLSCVLNGLHEELLVAMKTAATENGTSCNGTAEANGHISDESDEDDWQVIGKKNRSMITRSAALSCSPIKAIFGGETRSVLTAGSETSAVLQPFFTLQLDVQDDEIESVKDALGQLTAKEPVQGYVCPKTKKEVEAYRRTTLEELPPVLILHFKRFVYDKDGGSKKLLKKTDYPMELEIGRELLSPEAKSKNSAKHIRSYKLFAVVYHDGKEAMKGHYIADIFHAGIGGWLRCDDRNIILTTEARVQRYNSPCVPYLLFYGRSEGQVSSPQSK